MSSEKIKKRKSSIVFKVTLWYSFFIILLILLMLGLSFFISERFIESDSKRELMQKATEISEDINDYESFEDGVYHLIYDEKGKVINGNPPKEFNKNLPFNNSVVNEFNINGKTYFYYDIELDDDDNWLRVVMLKNSSVKELNSFFLVILLISPLLLIIIIWGGYRILKKAFEPVDKISKTALSIQKSNDFSKRIELNDKNDELHRLAYTFNSMLDSIEKSFNRERQFNNDVSHELRTPVSVILSESEYGLDFVDTIDDAKESYSVINKQAKRMRDMISQILELSKMESISTQKMELLNLSDILEEHSKNYVKLCEKDNIDLKFEIDENCFISGDEILIGRLIDNLVGNAMKFTKDKIKIKLIKNLSNCILEVEDNGIGISDEEKAKVWSRFYQVDDSRNKENKVGSGLGLSLVEKIVKMHNAEIELKSELNNGTLFRVIFFTENKK